MIAEVTTHVIGSLTKSGMCQTMRLVSYVQHGRHDYVTSNTIGAILYECYDSLQFQHVCPAMSLAITPLMRLSYIEIGHHTHNGIVPCSMIG